ncbi:mitogen-activated protein kinase kinase kinase 18-like [Papaver somniferum]|uniref:mitogen-activated protein kinase kinase kinase 18-like n=1 Tax=Papaver somniferum TaxID=3469 RepID=UPI000E703869|nr:mitogen-activated protein kinase kinase kinase 18-like [Papaver somniferum]
MNWIRGKTIGRGSSAVVSMATSQKNGDLFAVKSAELYRAEFLKREERILSTLDCPQIIKYIGSDTTNENGELMYNLFMEYVSGGTLTEAIQEQKGKLDEFSIKSYTGEILRGLNYLHSNGLVHCDIKGRNILIGENGAKIADLGCAKWMDEVSNSSRISGTPVFMAPEVARGEEQGCPADIWALGCTIIEMATGRAPWSSDGDDAVSVLYRIAFSGEVPEFPSFLSENAKDFLSKCLERDLKKRWNTNQLLKHPFVDEFNSKQFKESKMKSPTSILDQDFWDSMEEVIETPRNVSTGCSSVSVIDRLRKISSPIEPNWECEDDWITIRNENCQESVNFSGEEFEFSTISVDEPTTAPTSGSDSVYNDDDEDKVEFSGRFDFENDEVPFNFFDYNFSFSSNSSIRFKGNSSSKNSYVNLKFIITKCKSRINLNFEIKNEIIMFSTKFNSLKIRSTFPPLFFFLFFKLNFLVWG